MTRRKIAASSSNHFEIPESPKGVPRATQRLEGVAEQDMDCCSASSVPDQQQNRLRDPTKVLQPSNAAAAPKESRGRPFERGNPGRPRGSKNRTTRLLEELVAGEGEKLIQKTVELALGGNVKCLQLCLDRLMPRRAGRPLDFTLPAVNEARDIVAAMAAITTAVNDGRLTAEEAGQLMHILNGYTKALETHDLATRIAALESQLKKSS